MKSMNIHQVAITDADLSNFVPPNRENIQHHFVHNGFSHHFWEASDVKDLAYSYGDTHVWDAIEKVRPNAFKADLARYYIVSKIGGWYVDLNTYFDHAPTTKEYEAVFFRDVHDLAGTSWAVYNGLFYFEPGHVILEDLVDMCVENINNKYYGAHPLCPTGPNLMGMAVAKQGLDEGTNYLIGKSVQHEKNLKDGFYINNRLFALYKPGKNVVGVSGLPGSNNYLEMWQDGKVYS
jgi:hypothetical protein